MTSASNLPSWHGHSEYRHESNSRNRAAHPPCPPHHVIQQVNLSRQGPNQGLTLCRNFWLCAIYLWGSKNHLSAIHDPSHSFFFSYLISNCTLPYAILLSQSMPISSPGPWIPLPHTVAEPDIVAILWILIIFPSTTQVPPPFKLHWKALWAILVFTLTPLISFPVAHACLKFCSFSQKLKTVGTPTILALQSPSSVFTEPGTE